MALPEMFGHKSRPRPPVIDRRFLPQAGPYTLESTRIEQICKQLPLLPEDFTVLVDSIPPDQMKTYAMEHMHASLDSSRIAANWVGRCQKPEEVTADASQLGYQLLNDARSQGEEVFAQLMTALRGEGVSPIAYLTGDTLLRSLVRNLHARRTPEAIEYRRRTEQAFFVHACQKAAAKGKELDLMRNVAEGKTPFQNPMSIEPKVDPNTQLVTGAHIVVDIPPLPQENVEILKRILPCMWEPKYDFAEFTNPETPMGFLRELARFAGNPFARELANRLRIHIKLMQTSPKAAAQSPLKHFAPTDAQIAQLYQAAEARRK